MSPLPEPAIEPRPFERLTELIAGGEVLVLSGAGLSTESGIPDYRGPTGRARPASPMTIAEFGATQGARRRYWARSHLGWRAIAAARPNLGHRAVARLEHAGLVSAVITQNVDDLHQKAGSYRVVDLHGALSRVICLACDRTMPRPELESLLNAANAHWPAATTVADAAKPDGDHDVDSAAIEQFQVVDCPGCHGILKPDVVFFGESVRPEKVARCYELVERCELLLVLGSSLTVASGFRFVSRAVKRSIPIAVINQGHTRADRYAEVKIDAPLGRTLTDIAGLLSSAN